MRDQFAYEPIRMKAYFAAASGKKPLPRLIRKIFAKTTMHYAWLQGHTGSFILPVLERCK